APRIYGGQIMCGPCHDESYIEAYGSGVSNGSCGSNSSTKSMKRSWLRADRARIRARLPWVALVPALVVPRGEVGVIIFAADFKQMRMIRDQFRDDAGRAKIGGQRTFPYFDRSPRLPQKIDRSAQDVVTRRDAWQRACVVTVEANRAPREGVEVGRGKLASAVSTEHVAIEAVEQYYDGVFRPRHRGFMRAHRSDPSKDSPILFAWLARSTRLV